MKVFYSALSLKVLVFTPVSALQSPPWRPGSTRKLPSSQYLQQRHVHQIPSPNVHNSGTVLLESVEPSDSSLTSTTFAAELYDNATKLPPTTATTQSVSSSPYARFCLENDEHEDSQNHSWTLQVSDSWLIEATKEYMEAPLGSLHVEDAQDMTLLMATWSKRREPLHVESLLKRLIDEQRYRDGENSADSQQFSATTQHYVYAMEAWSRSDIPDSAHRVQQIHDALVYFYEISNSTHLQPTITSYRTLINAWVRCNDTALAVEMAEKSLFAMAPNLQQLGNYNPNLGATLITTMMDLYSRHDRFSAPFKSKYLWDRMDEWNIGYNSYLYSVYQNIWARSGSSGATQIAMELLQQLMKLYQETGDGMIKPTCMNYNAVLNAASREASHEAASLSETLLAKMELPVEQGGYNITPDRLSYSLTVLACARAVDSIGRYAERALSVLERMEKQARLEEGKRVLVSSAAPAQVTVDVECFNIVLTAFSKSRNSKAITYVNDIIRRMERYSLEGNEELRPSVRSWNAVLHTYARAPPPRNDKRYENFERAEEVLSRMFSLHESGVRNVQPNAYSYAAVLAAYQRSASAEAARRADDLVNRMEALSKAGELDFSPDVYHYTMLCGTWAKSGEKHAADRCNQILKYMIERDKAGVPNIRPNTRTYNAVIDCLSKSGRCEEAEQLLYYMLNQVKNSVAGSEPDLFSFNSVIQAYCHRKDKNSGRRAEALLDRFLEYQEECGLARGPDARSFTNILAHYGKSNEPDAPYRAEYVLNRMVSLFKAGCNELAPSTYTLKLVMSSYSKAKHPDAGLKAERMLKLLDELRTVYKLPGMELDCSFMNCVLFAWSVCGAGNAGERAEEILNHMEKLYECGNVEVAPWAKSYELVISAYSKSTVEGKARKALSILRRLQSNIRIQNSNIVTDNHVYSLVLNACAFSNAKTPAENGEVFQIAKDVFADIFKSSQGRPSPLAYGWYILACGRLEVSEELKISEIERAMTLCAQDNAVNSVILSRLSGAVSDFHYRRILRNLGL